MSDIMAAEAENLRTLALNEEQAIETARRQLDAAVHRRDAFLAAADLLCPGPEIPTLAEAIEQRDAGLRDEQFAVARLALTPAPVDEDPVADELPVTKPATAGRPKGSPQVGGKPRQYDRAEIARVARQAQADRLPMNMAVAAHFGCSEMAAGKLIQTARKAGEDIPHLLPPRGKETTPKPDKPVDRTPDTTPVPTVVPAQVTAPKQVDTGADKLVPLFPPGTPRPPYAPKVGESVLVCDDCGQPFERNVTRLSLHTHDTHDRPPYQAERLPRNWTVEDDQEWFLELATRHA